MGGTAPHPSFQDGNLGRYLLKGMYTDMLQIPEDWLARFRVSEKNA